jgi:hypothetical protein
MVNGTKLFSCLYGSGLYGTTTPESDRDLKVVYLPSLDDLIMGNAPKNKVKPQNKLEGVRNKAGDEDEEWTPLYMFARDFIGGQTYALELAYAVEYTGAEQTLYHPEFNKFCRDLRARFLTSDIKAMTCYAVDQASLYSDRGTRLNAVKAAYDLFVRFPVKDKPRDCAEAFEEAAKPLIAQYPESLSIDMYAIDKEGLVLKPCFRVLEKTLPFSSSFGFSLTTIQALIARYGDRAKKAAETAADWKATMHALRIVNEGIVLMSGGTLEYPYSPEYVKQLLRIKAGEYRYEVVTRLLDIRLAALQKLSDESPLPKLTAELRLEFEEWLLRWTRKFYRL